jgi:hypothetical protein
MDVQAAGTAAAAAAAFHVCVASTTQQQEASVCRRSGNVELAGYTAGGFL